jgi:glutamine synthetase
MNTILADSLEWMADKLSSALSGGASIEAAVHQVLKEVMDKHDAVIFNGNGYSAEWHKMAVEERGLANLRTTADALPVLKEGYIQELFSKTGVLSPVELASRFETYAEQYILSIEVESRIATSLAKTVVYPATVEYLSELASTIKHLKDLGVDFDKSSAEKIAGLTNVMNKAIDKLSAVAHQHDFASVEEHMQHCAQVIRPAMDELRQSVDALEGEVADSAWPLPTYQEMLFIK